MYQLFIFDFDGTLADSGPRMAELINKAAAKFGFRQLSRADIEALRGRDNRAILKEIGVPLWRLPQIASYLRDLVDQEATSPPLFPGIANMLAQLHARGATLALVSSNSEAAIRRALGSSAALIDRYACAASMFGKAAKFKRILKATRIAPASAIAIGDETRDVEAARGAGVAAGAVAWGYATPELLRSLEPDHLFTTPADIAALAKET